MREVVFLRSLSADSDKFNGRVNCTAILIKRVVSEIYSAWFAKRGHDPFGKDSLRQMQEPLFPLFDVYTFDQKPQDE